MARKIQSTLEDQGGGNLLNKIGELSSFKINVRVLQEEIITVWIVDSSPP